MRFKNYNEGVMNYTYQSIEERAITAKKVLIFFIAAVYLLFLAGCMTVRLTAEGLENPVAMTGNVNKKYTIVKHFSSDLKAWFALFDLVTISEPNVREALHNEILSAHGDAVINVKIQGHTTFTDGAFASAVGIIGALVLPAYGVSMTHLLNIRTYTVEGDVIKYAE